MNKAFEKAADIIAEYIEKSGNEKPRPIIAIDGRCGSGKSSFAACLSKRLDAEIFHMDDFFLRPQQRTPQRLAAAGENVDHERFLEEVLIPLSRSEAFSFRPFDCSTMSLGEETESRGKGPAIVEGTYCCHKALRDYYDFKVFMSTDSKTQLERIRVRNGEKMAERFQNLWIPMEEAYFSAFDVAALCDMILET